MQVKLADLIRMWRASRNITSRELAAEIGVSHSTVLRIEQNKQVDGDSLAKLLIWLITPEARNVSSNGTEPGDETPAAKGE